MNCPRILPFPKCQNISRVGNSPDLTVSGKSKCHCIQFRKEINYLFSVRVNEYICFFSGTSDGLCDPTKNATPSTAADRANYVIISLISFQGSC